MGKHQQGFKRNSRMLAAERRRIARQILREFYQTEAFEELPSKVRLSMLELCSKEPSYAETTNLAKQAAKKASHCHKIGPVVNAGEKDVEFHTYEQTSDYAAFCGGTANG